MLKRKAALQKELRRTERIVYCQHVGESGERLFQAADQLGLEGVIGKKADSPYRAGRTRTGFTGPIDRLQVLVTFDGTNAFILDNFVLNVAALPEPASVALLAIGLAGLGFSRRKRAIN